MNKILGNKTAIAAFVAPSLILFGGIIFYSIIMSFRYSLLDWNGFGEGIFVGFSNYAKMFQDKVFLRSAVNSLLLGFVTLVTQLPLALLLALLLTSGIKGEGFYRTVFFIPMTLSSVVIRIGSKSSNLVVRPFSDSSRFRLSSVMMKPVVIKCLTAKLKR